MGNSLRLFSIIAFGLWTLAACSEKNMGGEISTGPEAAIIGGEVAKDDDVVAASTVALRFRADPYEEEGKVLKSFCTGSLIARNIVLTAAHCVQKIREDIAIEAVFNVDANKVSSEAIAIDAILAHPKYMSPRLACQGPCDLTPTERAARMGANDLALLLLRSDAPANYHVVTLNKDQNLPVNLDIITVGYGQRVEGKTDTNGILKKFSGKGEYLKSINKILSLSTKDSSACYGDSGGPIYIKKNNKLIQLGVASHRVTDAKGYPCLNTETTAYTSTASYIDWIEKSKAEIKEQADYINAPWSPK